MQPTTLDEAVAHLVSVLSEEDKATVRDTPEDDLIRFHHGWGTGIRNGFGLWGGNPELLASCGGGTPTVRQWSSSGRSGGGCKRPNRPLHRPRRSSRVKGQIASALSPGR
jgi:hypothetical protein